MLGMPVTCQDTVLGEHANAVPEEINLRFAAFNLNSKCKGYFSPVNFLVGIPLNLQFATDITLAWK